MDCPFCHIREDKGYLFENQMAYAILDHYPVSEGHTLIISKRHAETFFELTDEEVVAFHELAVKVKQYLEEKYHPDAFNIGFNCGELAGQTVMHCHMHIIPRYRGDCDNPRGGVRKILRKPKVDY
ncbi:MAG TPA: HIT family protein [Bacilli bacterium]|nr:HIT family protein [Bacilli bacterium]HPS18967.1 HIT family protein [Bacilli bacterium]